MSEPRPNDENYLWASQGLVQDFARSLGLDLSERSLHEVDELAFLMTRLPLNMYANRGSKAVAAELLERDLSEPGFKRGFQILDQAVAVPREVEVAGLKAEMETARLPSPARYAALKKLLNEYPGGGLSMMLAIGSCANYIGEVARRNLKGKWVVHRTVFGGPTYGIEIESAFYPEAVFLDAVMDGIPTVFYKALRAKIHGLPIEDIKLSSEVPPPGA